jgi:hypothetical protein
MKLSLLASGIVALCAVALATQQGAAAERTALDRTAEGVTIFARPTVLGWTQTATLFGAAEGAAPQDIVEIQAKGCGSTFFKTVVEAHAGTGGGWSTPVGVTITSTFRAVWKGKLSPTVTVRKGANVSLVRRRAGGSYIVAVTAMRSFWRKRVEIQQRRQGTWRTVRTVALTDSVGSTGIVSASEATVRLSVPKGTRLRAVLPSGQAKPCYVRSVSKVVVA